MEDGLHDYGITARSGGSGAKYLSRGYPFAGQPTVDGGDDAHQSFGVEGDDSTLGVFLADSLLTSQLIRTRNKSRPARNPHLRMKNHRLLMDQLKTKLQSGYFFSSISFLHICD